MSNQLKDLLDDRSSEMQNEEIKQGQEFIEVEKRRKSDNWGCLRYSLLGFSIFGLLFGIIWGIIFGGGIISILGFTLCALIVGLGVALLVWKPKKE